MRCRSTPLTFFITLTLALLCGVTITTSSGLPKEHTLAATGFKSSEVSQELGSRRPITAPLMKVENGRGCAGPQAAEALLWLYRRRAHG